MQAFLNRNYYLLLCVLLASLLALAFYAGLLEGRRGERAQIVLACSEETLSTLSIPSVKGSTSTETRIQPTDLTASATTTIQIKGKYVGSKNGTKYYAPQCGSVKRIKPQNYIWFTSKEDATLQGYTPGKC